MLRACDRIGVTRGFALSSPGYRSLREAGMISLALLLAAHTALPIKHYPGWELYRYGSGCSLVAHLDGNGAMQIAEDAGAYRTFIGIRDARFDSVEAGRPYDIAPVPVRDGTPGLCYMQIAARGRTGGYIMP